MRIFLLFLTHIFCIALSSNATFSIQEVETEFFNRGLFKMTSKTIREQELLKNNTRAQLLLLSMGDFRPYFTEEENQEELIRSTCDTFKPLYKKKDPLAVIIAALWHINDVIVEDHETFPDCYNALLTEPRDPEKGISLLFGLMNNGNGHAAYILGQSYLRPSITGINQRAKGFNYLKASAQLSHLDAQEILKRIGIDWSDTDQFGDHCKWWFLIPNCDGIHCEASSNSLSRGIRACVGYGPSERDHGWVDCNFLCCGFSTELNSAGIATYATRGFLNMLRALEHPIKLCTAGTTIATTVLEALNSPLALPIGVVATGCATLSAFIKQETSPEGTSPNAAPQIIDQQPVSIQHQ